MERLSLAFLALLHQVSVGSLIPLLFLQGVGRRGFFKLIAFTCLSFEGIALGIQLQLGCWMTDDGCWSTFRYPTSIQHRVEGWQLLSSTIFLLLLVAFTAFLFLKDEGRGSPSLRSGQRLFLRLALLGGAVNLFFVALPFTSHQSPVLLILSFSTSSLFLGSVVVAMLLGHWYLVEPGLSIRPFKRLAALYLGSCLLQGLVVLVSTLFALLGGPSSKMTLATYQYALIGRIGLGIFLPLSVGALVWEALKIPHTQAATGLLYVAILLVVAGELLGRYLLTVGFIPL